MALKTPSYGEPFNPRLFFVTVSIPGHVARLPAITPTGKLIYGLVHAGLPAGETDPQFPPQAICEELGLPLKQVERGVKELIKTGLVERKKFYSSDAKDKQ